MAYIRINTTSHLFSGFFPADQPELVITVVVDEPKLRGLAMAGLWQHLRFEELQKLVFNIWVSVLQMWLPIYWLMSPPIGS